MMHHPCLLEKVFFLAFKTLLSPFGTKKKHFFINFKLYDLANGKEYQIMLKFCTIHLAFDKGYFEAVLIEYIPRTLGVNEHPHQQSIYII
jgi:hypothetical protein